MADLLTREDGGKRITTELIGLWQAATRHASTRLGRS